MSSASAHTRRIRLIAWATLAMYLGLAVTMTHLPKAPRELQEFSDKYLHMAGYFVYGLLLYTAMGVTFSRLRLLWLIVLAMLGVWAAIDELTQPLFGRTCDIVDWRADMIGVFAAIAMLGLLRWIATPKRRRVRFT